jgi:hypothetical protein
VRRSIGRELRVFADLQPQGFEELCSALRRAEFGRLDEQSFQHRVHEGTSGCGRRDGLRQTVDGAELEQLRAVLEVGRAGRRKLQQLHVATLGSGPEGMPDLIGS